MKIKSAKSKRIKKNLDENKKRKLLSSCINCRSILFKYHEKENISFLNDLNINNGLIPNNKNSYNNKNLLNTKKPLSTSNLYNTYNYNKINKEIQTSNFLEFNKNKNHSVLNTPRTIYTSLCKKRNLNIKNLKKYNINKKNELNITHNILQNILKRKIYDKMSNMPNLCLSFNNRYDSYNQKTKDQNNIDKFNSLRINIKRNPEKKFRLIKEFMINNGINQKKYFKTNNIIKFESYLNKSININPKNSISQIIKNLINNKDKQLSYNKENEDDEIIRKEFYSFSPLSNRLSIKKVKKISNNINNISLKQKELRPDLFLSSNNSKTKNENKDNTIIKKNNLSELVKNLEYELKQIKSDKLNQLESNNNNKFVNKIKNLIKKQEHIKKLMIDYIII